MKKGTAFLLVLSMLIFSMSSIAWSAENDETEEAIQAQDAAGQSVAETEQEAENSESGPLQDNIVTTKHTAVIQGKELAYTAQAGTMVLETAGETCEIFFTAYTLDGVEEPSSRPVTFAFNGGPGAGSMYLHVGCLGPRRIDVDEKGYPVSLPVGMKDNENSLLDLTDLVIIDAVGTGYSRPAGGSELDAFIGYDNDNRTIGDFIRQYVSRNNRWGSKKYVAGESYGTTRAVGVCSYLSDTYAMNLNGLILISSVNDYMSLLFESGNELPYASYIPTYAADAWYHGVAAEEYRNMELEDYLKEVRSFVEKEYVPALFLGDRLTEEEKNEVCEKLAGYTGLSKEFLAGCNLRVELDDFCEELLEDQKLMVGRYDGRITGPVTAGSLGDGDSDPSGAVFQLSYGNAFSDYMINELGYQTDRPYLPLVDDINTAWTFPIDGWGGYLSQEAIVHDEMSKNPFLKVWVLCGYYDGATPFYGAEWTFSHVFLNDDLSSNLSLTYYPCGHMVYMEKESFDKFRKDAEAWYQ